MHAFEVQPLNPDLHRREAFDCGVEALNRYLLERAGEDMKRKASGCWVIAQRERLETIIGYYTLSTESVESQSLPDLEPSLRKKLPNYRRLGAVLLGRLAVDSHYQGQGVGELLLLDAFHRVARADIPSVFMVTDPKNGKAEAFYAKYGFQRLTSERMFLPMIKILKMLDVKS